MKTLDIDIETYSSVNLLTRGVYNYAAAGDFKVLLFAYSIDGEEVQVVDMAQGEGLPYPVVAALLNPEVTKRAYNAQFERVCLSALMRQMGLMVNTAQFPEATVDGEFLNPKGWECTRVLASAYGYVGSLDFVCRALRLDTDKAKMKEGSRLIRLFSIPGKKDGRLRRFLPCEYPEDWETFKEYCKRDVVAEQEVRRTVEKRAPAGLSLTLGAYEADQRINDRGVAVDLDFVRNAAMMVDRRREELEEMVHSVMGRGSISPQSVKKWLSRTIGTPKQIRLCAETVERIREAIEKKYGIFSDKVTAFDAYVELQVKSVAKYSALLDFTCEDGRLRGGYFYCGARTGRWTSKGVQLQNLPRRTMGKVATEELRASVKSGDYKEMRATLVELTVMGKTTGNMLQALGQLVRTAFVAGEGYKLVSFDLKTIEPRILASLASQVWMLNCFGCGGDIYAETAYRLFGIGEPTKEQRDRAKVATLALGYGGGDEPMAAMAKQMGVKMGKDEALAIVKKWRKECADVVRLWHRLEDAALSVTLSGNNRKQQQWTNSAGLRCFYKDGTLCFQLPSGRVMCYPNAVVRSGSNVRSMLRSNAVSYEGASSTGSEWTTYELYGGKLTENVVQAIARDVLAEALIRLEAFHGRVVMHTHDEVTMEVACEDEAEAARAVFEAGRSWLILPGGTPSESSGLSEWYAK